MTDYNPDASNPVYGPGLEEKAARWDMADEMRIRRSEPDWYEVVAGDPDRREFGEVFFVTESRAEAEAKIAELDDPAIELSVGHDELDERPEEL